MKPTAYITQLGYVRRKSVNGFYYTPIDKMMCDRHVHWIVSRTGIAHSCITEQALSHCGMWSGRQGDHPERFRRRCVKCCYHVGMDPNGGLDAPAHKSTEVPNGDDGD